MKYTGQDARATTNSNSGQVLKTGNSPAIAVRRAINLLFSNRQVNVCMQLWDGTKALGRSDACCKLVIKEPEVVRELLLHPNLFRLVEAYLHGRLDVEGDFEALFELGAYLGKPALSLQTRLTLLRIAWSLPRKHSQERKLFHRHGSRPRKNSRRTIAHHYDLGNDFYRLWLDPEMVYSCAYFSTHQQSLENAQRDKLDYLCHKLRLQPGQKVLDIGCGWGALALWAATHYGVKVHGITLSKEQYRHARRKIKDEGMERDIRIDLLDYRDISGKSLYDRVVSVGMFEHIGIRNFPRYFGMVNRVLKPGGLFLNHGITSDEDWTRSPCTDFINHYIFPDGELARISTVSKAMEDAGFEILDVENLRPHYTLTLRHWVHNLEARKDEAIRSCGDATYRLWRLYMAGCAFNFNRGGIGIHQVLAGQHGKSQPIPLRRNDL
jgi:cyclopropane-fatty-acyl-phospholipid synthase